MGTSPYPCCFDCVIFSDNFMREGPDAGCLWDPRYGTWQISNEKLGDGGVKESLLICNTPHLQNDESFYVTARCVDAVDGNTYRVIVNYKDDLNFYYVEFWYHSTEDSLLSLYKRSNGADTPLVINTIAVALSDTPEIHVCFNEEAFYAYVDVCTDSEAWVDAPGKHSGGYKVGVGNGANQQVKFEQFVFQEHWKTNEDCYRCVCYCEENALAPNLKLKMSATGEFNACYDGTMFYMASAYPGWWEGADDLPCDCSAGDPLHWGFTLECEPGDDPVGGFKLHVQFEPLEEFRHLVSTPNSTCDPLNLEFVMSIGPQCEPNTQGTDFKFNITE